MVVCDPKTLLSASKCLPCLTPAQRRASQVATLCKVAGVGLSILPAPNASNFSLSFNGAFVLANAGTTAPLGVTSAQLWTSPDGVNYTLNQTIIPPTANNTAVPPPTTGNVIFGKFRWCAGSTCGPFGAPIKITANANLFNSLTSYWKFDENVASGTRFDSTASGNNLTDVNNNMASTATAIRGRAIVVTATAGMRLSHADTAGLAAGAGVSFTIVLWARCAVQTPNVPLLTKFSGANQDYLIWQNATNNDLSWQVRNLANNASPNIDSGAAPPVGSFIQIACGYDDGLQQIFMQVNAGARATAACVGVQRTVANFVVGGYDDNVSTTFNGVLDELGFWQRALTAAEVSALYNGGASLAYPFS